MNNYTDNTSSLLTTIGMIVSIGTQVSMQLLVNYIGIIGASMSEPHTCQTASPAIYISKVSIKRFLKRDLAHVGMVQCMNALVDKVHKQEVPCTQ